MKNFARIVSIWVSFVFMGSCFENPDCIGLRNNFVNISFKKLFDGEADTVGVFQATISGSDSIFYQQVSASKLLFPLGINQAQQSIDFETTRGNFSVGLSYETQTQFEDVDCGPRFIMSGLDVTSHNFDSLRLINTTPSSDPKNVHLEVYRCPVTELLKIGFRQLNTDAKANGEALEEPLKGVSVDFLPFVFYANTELSSVVLPVNLSGPTTQITFDNAEHGLESLSLSYSISNEEVFKVCGSQPFVSDIQITNQSGYDIVKVQKDSLTDPPSTNILLLRCPKTNFIELRLKSAPGSGDTPFQINKVTASYTSEVFYVNESTASLILPLDEAQDQTEFVIEFETGAKQITFSYVRSQQIFHEQCNQTLFSGLQVVSSDFTTAPISKDDVIKFPTVVNFEIIND